MQSCVSGLLEHTGGKNGKRKEAWKRRLQRTVNVRLFVQLRQRSAKSSDSRAVSRVLSTVLVGQTPAQDAAFTEAARVGLSCACPCAGWRLPYFDVSIGWPNRERHVACRSSVRRVRERNYRGLSSTREVLRYDWNE